MKTFLYGILINLVTSAIALIVAAALLPGFHLGFRGFLTAVVVFTVAQALLSGLVASLAQKHAPAITGAAALISTFLSLVITNLFGGGTHIRGFFTWILATVIVWAVTAVCVMLAPRVLARIDAGRA